jgi:hypothetical protein
VRAGPQMLSPAFDRQVRCHPSVTVREDLLQRAVLAGLQLAICYAQDLGCTETIDEIGTLKVQAARRFAGREGGK